MNTNSIINKYISKREWRVNENANIDYSLSSLMFHLSNRCIANYVLKKVYDGKIAEAHHSGDFHIHDLGTGISGYCAGWSLQKLLLEGFNGVTGKIESKPPKHLDTALLQIVNFLGTLQNEWSGAQALNSLDTLLSPFIRSDKLDYKAVKQSFQTFIYNLNIASRWGGQTPFTNITFDLTVPEDLANQPAIVGGKAQDKTYAEFDKERDMINRAFLEVLSEGDMKGRPFTFPIPTYGLTKDFDWDSDVANLLFKVTAKFGLPYFSNFINSDLKPSDTRSMCCRLRLDLKELRKNTRGGIFGSGDETGSVGVVTINMSRIGYLSKSEDDYFGRLKQLMKLAKDSLEKKRILVEKNITNGLLPFTRRYLGNLNHHFSTIGLLGMNESCLNFLGKDISTDEGKEFSIKTLRFMREQLKEFQGETKHIYNLEATPAEGASYRLAYIDRKKYKNIVTAGKGVPYYTNSTNLAVNNPLTIVDAFRHQQTLQPLYTGGSVFHIFLGEVSPYYEGCKILIKRVVENFKIPYLTFTPTYSICPDHGFLFGEHKKCPKCNSITEVYSRVTGYYRPVKSWNVGKQEEFKERKTHNTNE